MSSIKGIRKRLEDLFAGIAEAIPATGPLGRAVPVREVSRPRGWIWELDREGQYSWCSPEIERILGYSPDEVMGKPIFSIGFDPQVAETIQERVESRETIQQLIVEVQSKAGKSLPILIRAMYRVDATGEPLGYRGVCQLVEAEGVEFEPLAVEVPTPPTEVGATTPPTFAPSWGAILGFEDDEGVIQPLQEAEAGRDPLIPASEGLLVIPLQVQDEVIGVIELEREEDGNFWREEDRVLANAIAHELAITLQDARSYQLTQQALEEMREADRLKSQFLANMSHELRTPLNSIIGFSRVILKGIDGPVTETQEQDLNAIYNAGQHLLGLINNILDISKIEAGKMELAFTDVDLSEIIRGVMATAVGLVKDKPIELITDIPDELPFVQADNIRIRQVLLNLVSNAAKFTEEGHIGVSARTIQRGDRNEVVIAVFDTGPGINQEDQERIFEPFSQVDASPTRKTGGTGLGLSISRHLVELHGGVIWVESIPDEGSTFAFTLPFNPDLQYTRAARPLILGIDHDPTSLLQYREILEGSDFRFHALSRPDQTTEVVKALQPQAIILDLLEETTPPWRTIETFTKDPVLRAIPILLADYDERQEQGIVFPIPHWISQRSSSRDICDVFNLLLPEAGSDALILVIAPDPKDLSEFIQGVNAIECVQLKEIESIQDFEDCLRTDKPLGVIFNLSDTNELNLEVLEHLEQDSSELLRIGLLPEDLDQETTMGQSKFIASWGRSHSTPRDIHLDNLGGLLRQSLLSNP